MSDLTETQLPGVGVRHDFTTRAGDRLGMIAHRSGNRDLLLYDRDDPDACVAVIRLEPEDLRTLGEMLGASMVTEATTALQSIPGLAIDWIPVRSGSACSGCPLASVGVGGETGATIVAVIRGDETIPTPASDFELSDGDTVVAVGTPAGVRRLFELLQGA